MLNLMSALHRLRYYNKRLLQSKSRMVTFQQQNKARQQVSEWSDCNRIVAGPPLIKTREYGQM